MKKVTLIIAVVAMMISTSIFAQADQVKLIVNEVMTAYKNQDPGLLKKHASGIMKNIINDNYFKNKKYKPYTEMANEWDGNIREIRYSKESFMGNNVIFATAYIADVPKTKGKEIYAIDLSNNNNKGWVFIAEGISTENKSDFEQMTLTYPSNDASTAKKEDEAKTDFSIEMANGDTFNAVTDKILTDNFNKMNDDNFFLILGHGNNFIQAAYSEKGYTVEYKENGVQYSADEILSKEETLTLFKKYLNEDSDWNTGVQWEKQ
jgi:hypothetical protein